MAEDVEIPRWANSIQEFAMKMRAGLESEQASLHLHSWIDHVWGISRKDPKIRNTFTDICYSDSTILREHFQARSYRLLQLSDDLEVYHKMDCHLPRGQRMKFQGIDLQIAQFGRVPNSLFSFPHPKKKIKSMKNKRSSGLSGIKNLDSIGMSPVDLNKNQGSSSFNQNSLGQNTSRFEDFDIDLNSNN
jgi:hypothetical protein